LQAVVTSGIAFDEGFAEAVYQETSGHPFLTVKTMVDLFDWLIERDRRLGKMLRREEFGAFRRERLTPEALERSPHYSFMKKVVSSALTNGTKREHPWMFAVMTSIQRLARRYPGVLRCPEPEFKEMISDVCEPLGFTGSGLLSTAQMGNFLRFRDGQVGPAIPLLGRLAIGAQPDAG